MGWTDPTGKEIGRPFQGEIWFYTETSYASGVPSVHATSVSSVVEVARMETGDVNRYFRGIDSIYISKSTQSNVDRTFHLEYALQTDDVLLEYLIDRVSGVVPSLGFIVGANTDQTTSSYWEMKGCRCKNVDVSGGEGEPWKVSADFSVSATSVGTTGHFIVEKSSPTTGNDVTGDVCMFNVASTIKADTKDIAYVTKNFSVTINHNTQDLWTVGSREKKNVIESALDVTGSCDISLDDGGVTHFQDVMDSDEATSIIINTAHVSGAPVLTLSNTRFDSSSIDVSPGNEGMMESAPFTAKQIAVSTYT